MVLYIIGLGLGDEKDITVRGLEAVKSCKVLYLEYYTSILGVDTNKLAEFYDTGVPIRIADRNMVESSAEEIYMPAKDMDVGFLVVGDPLCATTHTDLMIRAKALGIAVEVIHNTSIMGGIASCGLQLYKYGYTVSIPFFEGDWKPSSFYDRIKYNLAGDMHTLCLLDIKVKEMDYNALARGQRAKHFPPKFMTINSAIEQLLAVEEDKKQGVISTSTLAVGMARVGQRDMKMVFGPLGELLHIDFGSPLHSLIICGEIHPLESEIVKYIQVSPDERLVSEHDRRKMRLKVDGDDEDSNSDNDDSEVEDAC